MMDVPGYEILATLAEKPRTLVFRAIRESDERPVVLKTCRYAYPTPRDLAKMELAFEICRDFDHPHLVRCLDLFSHGNGLILVMDDIGESALSLTLEHGPLSIGTAIDYAVKLASALEHIHGKGVIHRDLKPSNVVHHPVTEHVRLIDFSIASRISREKQPVVSLQSLEGSLQYLSPEQTGRMNRPVDYRTDFYAFGVTCYEMLTGQLPFSSLDPMELVHCHLAKRPVPVHKIRPEVPKALSEIVDKLMAKAAEDRYQSAGGLAADLGECQEQWRRGAIEIFELGERDELSIFQLPTRLYGRESEIDQMLQAFDEVWRGGIEVLLVAGYSGVGKSALLEEIHKPIVESRGYFISTKFDQFR
ncbi:MAG: protein kinase, partial [Acidobacteriota bacterium]